MSFGFSVGDFLAVGKLATEIITSLKDSGGSRTDYQDLVRELESLQTALVHLDKLTETKISQSLVAIKYSALSCRRPLEEFLTKIRKYEKSLGIRSKPRSIKGVIDKIKFPLAHKDEIQKMQAYLSVHIGTINILLTEYGFEKMQLAAETTEVSCLKVKKWLENTGDIIGRMQTSVVSQTHAVLKNVNILEKVYKILTGELKTSLQSFENVVAKVCVSTQQIYTAVLEIQSTLTCAPDIRWTFFQDPFIVEDALGRRFPVPSEYDYSLLDAVIRHKFQKGPGAAQVAAGDYEIMYTKKRRQVLSINSRLRPGCSMTMAILIGKPPSATPTEECCPMPQCQSINTTIVPGGGRRCTHCTVWFAQSKKKLNSDEDIWAAHKGGDQSTDREYTNSAESKKTADDDAKVVPFKNVKVADRRASKYDILKASSQPDEFYSMPPLMARWLEGEDDPRPLLGSTGDADYIMMDSKNRMELLLLTILIKIPYTFV